MHKKIFQILLIVTLFAPLLSFAAKMTNACNPRDSSAVQAAIIKYLDNNAGLHSAEITILKTRCSGNYASAIIHPKKPVTDDATVYLHKKKQWEVLSLGTDFDQDLLKQIPKDIRTY